MISTLATIIVAAGLYVYDGDGLGSGPSRLRIWGIDAPEIRAPGGYASRDYLRALIAGQALSCLHVDTDYYGRRVVRCTLPGGYDLGCSMIAAGHAVEFTRYSRGAYRSCRKH